jgi:hypothetical protein
MLLPSRRGTWLIPLLLAKPISVASKIAMREVIEGYVDHQWRFADFTGGALADNNFRIHRISDEFVDRFGSAEPIREITVVGHADRVWRHGHPDTRDEDAISQKRADDVFIVLAKDILMNPAGTFTPRQLQETIAAGDLKTIIVGVGARQRLTSNNRGAAPENRRVVIELSLTQSIPI